MNKENKLVESYQDFFNSFVWDIYLTVTYRYNISTSTALRTFKIFFKYLNTKDCIFFNKFIRCFIFFEKHSLRENIHVHSLIQGVDPNLASSLEDKCRLTFGESKIVPYKQNLSHSASGYLAQKINSPKLEHWDYLKINSRQRFKGDKNENSGNLCSS